MCMCLNKYNCTVLMNPSLRLYLYQCFNIAYSMTVTMILKLVHNLLYPSISYCAHVKKKMLAVGGLCPSKTLGLATPLGRSKTEDYANEELELCLIYFLDREQWVYWCQSCWLF